MNRTDTAATAQIATAGDRRRGQTHRTAAENGRPPSRAKANAIREAEVTVASPQRYCATTIPAHRAMASGRGSTPLMIHRNAPSPCAAAPARLGAASTAALSRTQPATPETRTERTMPRGTLAEAATVSSEAWAEASKPVIV